MPVLALVSAKGSPGVTTAAAALTAAASLTGDSLLVELDPSGGDVQILTGVEDEPGVVLAATELRRQVSGGAVDAHVSITPPGVPALLAPTAELMASSVIASVSERWRPALREYGGTVVVDAGRWDGAQATARRAAVGDLVAVVCRPSVASVEHARHIVDRLRTTARRPVVALVIGTRPYAPSEVAAELEVPLGGAIAWDPRGVGTLWAKGVSKSWGRTWLASSAAQSLESLLDLVPDTIAQAPVSRTPGTGRRPLLAPGEAPARASAPPPDEPAATTDGAAHIAPDSPPAGTPATGDGGDAGPDEPPAAGPEEPEAHGGGPEEPEALDAGDGPPEGPEPSGRPGGDAPPASHPGPAPTEAARRASAATGPRPPFPPPPPPPPAVPADEVGERPPVPPPPVPAHRSSAARGGTPTPAPAAPLASRAEASRAPWTVSPPQAADPSTRLSPSADEAGSVVLADRADPAPVAKADGEADAEAEGDREPRSNFERFTLGRAQQRARHADRAIATARLTGPDTPGVTAADDADEGQAPETAPGKGAAQHSPPVRRGRRLNYGLARRDRS